MTAMHSEPTQLGGAAPATLGFIALWQECSAGGGCCSLPPPCIPAPESALRSRPRVALPSARVFPEWTKPRLAGNDFAANGDNPLNSVSQPRGSLHFVAARLFAPLSFKGS